MFACPATDDFSPSRIDHMIDLHHPLAALSSRMLWQQIEAALLHLRCLSIRMSRPRIKQP